MNAPSSVDISWRNKLSYSDKCIFSTYIHINKSDQKNTFYYVNDGEQVEIATAIILTERGELPPNFLPFEQKIDPGETAQIDVSILLKEIGIFEFRGNMLLIIRNLDTSKPFIWNNKDFVSTWWSDEAAIQIGTAGFTSFNVDGKKEKKSYYMFCPAVVSSTEKRTRIVIFNHSTQDTYNDTISLTPFLHNLQGETIRGRDIVIQPFGSCSFDISEWFGEAGRELLAKTGGRGSITTTHIGHTFSSFFFYEDKNGALLSGRHTQPALLVVLFQPKYNCWVEYLGSKFPFMGHVIPFFSFLKHNPETLATFYPHQSNYLGTWWTWFKQSRFVVYGLMIMRALYFFIRRGFHLDEIRINEKSELNSHVIQHNVWNNFKLFQFSRGRIESLLYPLKSIPSFNPSGRTLCIGPKNEGEILLLSMHGFKDVIGIDLFSYSPKILLMDIHCMTFSDNTFDTIFCGWVLKYSYDIKRAVAEIIRVAKDGAIVVCSFGRNMDGSDELDFIVTPLAGGVSELLSYFGSSVGHVYWWNEDIIREKSRVSSVIFRVTKGESKNFSTQLKHPNFISEDKSRDV